MSSCGRRSDYLRAVARRSRRETLEVGRSGWRRWDLTTTGGFADRAEETLMLGPGAHEEEQSRVGRREDKCVPLAPRGQEECPFGGIDRAITDDDAHSSARDVEAFILVGVNVERRRQTFGPLDLDEKVRRRLR
jgi:hypothetical protein